jgi:hypothetical protein
VLVVLNVGAQLDAPSAGEQDFAAPTLDMGRATQVDSFDPSLLNAEVEEQPQAGGREQDVDESVPFQPLGAAWRRRHLRRLKGTWSRGSPTKVKSAYPKTCRPCNGCSSCAFSLSPGLDTIDIQPGCGERECYVRVSGEVPREASREPARWCPQSLHLET